MFASQAIIHSRPKTQLPVAVGYMAAVFAILLHHGTKVYMHRGGFCRFSMSRYSADKSNLNDLGSHLTNVAVFQHNFGGLMRPESLTLSCLDIDP